MKQTEFRVMARTCCLTFELIKFETEQEAIEFCEKHHWEFKDQYDFVYELYID